eukprot:Polyplicarium_translucidae@DN2806_c0_g1_i2.p1
MSTFPPQTPGEPVSVIPKDIELCRFIENGRFLRTFQDVHLIGKGGFGTVFAATHRLEPTRTMYALKVVELELLDNQNLGTRRYFREVSTNQDLLSKHVVRYFTWWCEEPQFLPAPSEVPRHAHAANLAMQKQRSLTRRAPAGSNRRPPLPSPSPISKGLRDIHAKGVVHRDIKPENIFVDPESGSLKIGDFGLARFIEAQHTTIPSSQDGSSQGQNGTAERGMFHVDSLASVRGRLIGTPGYAAPEGGAFCTGKADVFSAALILLELLCPRFNTAMERLKTLEKFRITGECPAFLDGALPEWCGLLHAMGQHDPPRRPAAAVVYSRVKQNLRDLCTNS